MALSSQKGRLRCHTRSIKLGAVDELRAMNMRPVLQRALDHEWRHYTAQAQTFRIQGRRNQAERAAAIA